MPKWKLFGTSLLLAIFLVGCNSDEESEPVEPESDTESEEVETEEPVKMEEEADEEEEEAVDSTEEDDGQSMISQEEKDQLLERYDDHLRIGETGEFERNDLTHDHVEITIHSVRVVDEVDGESPDNDHFLLVNVTVEDLIGDHNYGDLFIRGWAEGRSGRSNQNEREELVQEFNHDEPGISTGDLVFDMEMSDYYRFYIANTYFIAFNDEIEGIE